MVLRPGEAPLDESKKKVVNHAKENNRTYAIIMNEKPRHHFRLRYVVYAMGIFMGCKALYNRNAAFRDCCDGLRTSYREGSLVDGVKELMYNAWLAMVEYGRQCLEKVGMGGVLKITDM